MFIAAVMVWCASGLSEPRDIALAMKRRTCLAGGSTASDGQARAGGTDFQQIAQHCGCFFGGRRAKHDQASADRGDRGYAAHARRRCLQRLDALRLPGMRLSLVGLAEAHPAVVRQIRTRGRAGGWRLGLEGILPGATNLLLRARRSRCRRAAPACPQAAID